MCRSLALTRLNINIKAIPIDYLVKSQVALSNRTHYSRIQLYDLPRQFNNTPIDTSRPDTRPTYYSEYQDVCASNKNFVTAQTPIGLYLSTGMLSWRNSSGKTVNFWSWQHSQCAATPACILSVTTWQNTSLSLSSSFHSLRFSKGTNR